MNQLNHDFSSNSSTELQNHFNDLIEINNSNKQSIENFSRFSVLLDKIELSINLRAKQDIKDLIKIVDSINQDIEIFKTICTNTAHK